MKNDGGPAFPKGFPDAGTTSKGMSLRDWFAGMALQGLLSSQQPDWTASDEGSTFRAYKLADAMLAEREKSDAPSP